MGNMELRINGLAAIVDSMSHSAYGGPAAESSHPFDFMSEWRESGSCALDASCD